MKKHLAIRSHVMYSFNCRLTRHAVYLSIRALDGLDLEATNAEPRRSFSESDQSVKGFFCG